MKIIASAPIERVPDWELAWRSYGNDPFTFDVTWLAHYAVSVLGIIRVTGPVVL